jgi:hypothetical protein
MINTNIILIYNSKYATYRCYLEFLTYATGNKALRLIDSTDGSPVATCTVNLPDLKSDEIAIKDYSENQGMLDFLLENNIITSPHRYLESGYITNIPVCKLKQ